MKVFLVAYLMGKMAVVVGPLEASGDLQANLDWCNKYVREEIQPKYEKNLRDPERLAKLREINPDFNKDSLKYGCELHQQRPKLENPVPLL